LRTRTRVGQAISFDAVTLETCLDSPLLTGAYFRKISLDRSDGSAELDLAGDVPDDVAASDETIAKFSNLIHQADLEFGARHWRNYHFLVTASDAIDFDGIEHHESSDNRAHEDTFTDPEVLDYDADLLPHEFVHSWNGKYRRPDDLQVPNYQDPERTDMLWVYEGLTEYLGNVLASRSGLRTRAEFRVYMHVLAVGGRRDSVDALHAVLRATATTTATTPIPFVVDDFV
jgi:predicted metalloprotease with PDZ domain